MPATIKDLYLWIAPVLTLLIAIVAFWVRLFNPGDILGLKRAKKFQASRRAAAKQQTDKEFLYPKP